MSILSIGIIRIKIFKYFDLRYMKREKVNEMEKEEIRTAFKRIEEEVNRGNLKAVEELKFWKLVEEVKKNSKLASEFAGVIGKIDSKLFDARIKLKLGYGLGTAIELFGAVMGIVILIYAVKVQGSISIVLYLLSAIALMTALHPISHSIAGKIYGIELKFYFLNGPLLIEPTLKVDYESYIKAEPKSRAMFHLAGAVNSVAATLFVFLVSLAFDAPSLAKLAALIWFVFTALSEIIPIMFIKLGIKKILFADFRKSDSYRTLRELKYTK